MAVYRITIGTNSSGAASVSSSPVRFTGNLRYVSVDYKAALSASTNFSITDDTGRTLITKGTSATDFVAYPMVQSTDSGGTVIAAQYWFQYLYNTALTFTVSGSSNSVADAIVVTVVVDEG